MVLLIPAGLTLVWGKKWLLRRQQRVLPPVCVQITPCFARFWSGTEPCWTYRSSLSLSWRDTCRTHPQVRHETSQLVARTSRGFSVALMIMELRANVSFAVLLCVFLTLRVYLNTSYPPLRSTVRRGTCFYTCFIVDCNQNLPNYSMFSVTF